MFTIRKLKKKDIPGATKLVYNTYKRFCAKDATKIANQRYQNQYDIKKAGLPRLEKEFLRTKIAFVAMADNKIIGVIRGGTKCIGNLFVDAKHQRKGIAGWLVKKFEKQAKKQGASALKITASLYSVPFYLSASYKKSTGIRNHKGIKVQPMKKIFN